MEVGGENVFKILLFFALPYSDLIGELVAVLFFKLILFPKVSLSFACDITGE